MKVAVFVVLVSAMSTTCSNEPLYSTEYINIDTNDEAQWVIDRARDGADLWVSHGFEFDFGQQGNISLYRVDEHAAWGESDLLSAYSFRHEQHSIYIREDASPYNGNCFVARVIGTAIGVHEVRYSEPSLMDPGYITPEGEECPWSAADEAAVGALKEAR